MSINQLIEILTMLKNDGYEEVFIASGKDGNHTKSDIEITEKRLEGQVTLWAKEKN